MAGSFVAEHAALAAAIPAVAGAGGVHVVHGQEWPGGTARATEVLRPAFEEVLDRLRAAGGTRVHGVAGPVDRVPVFTVGGADWARRGEALVRDLSRVIGTFASPVVHGHVGYLGGLAAARLAEPGARVFATEHSTALRDVLAQPGAREHYAELIERAEAVFCVSDLLRRQILDAVPDPHDRVRVLPNPVDFTGVPRRSAPPTALRRWVFAGSLTERKGVLRLVRAFTAAARDDGALTLPMFGEGPLAGRLVDVAREAGAADRLELRGVVRHRDLLAALPGFDLLLAPSSYETFHLAVPEAVAAGLPVIVTRSGGPQEALAGVEALVGRFVEVSEDPDEIVAAWRELSANLDTLDLAAARATLDARYGRAAIAGELAKAYDLAGEPPAAAAADATGPTPDRVVLAAVSGWRRYHVEAELEAVRALGVPATLITDDDRLARQAAAAGVAVAAAGTPQPPLRRLRRALGRWRRDRWRRDRWRRPAASRGVARRSARLDGAFLEGATLVLGDCQSAPLARTLLAAHPGLRPVVELDRTGVLAPSPDMEVGHG
jgi:glycogen(starch) synthase